VNSTDIDTSFALQKFPLDDCSYYFMYKGDSNRYLLTVKIDIARRFPREVSVIFSRMVNLELQRYGNKREILFAYVAL
jgi:hypothetical protein